MVVYDLFETSDENIDINDFDSIDVNSKISYLTLNIADVVNLILPEFSGTRDAIFSSESVLSNQSRDI
ncbi:20435_t:CDS:1, partial [Cetraspora pellucida]